MPEIAANPSRPLTRNALDNPPRNYYVMQGSLHKRTVTMKPAMMLLIGSILPLAGLVPAGHTQPRDAARPRIDVLEMTAVPDGNYRVNLQAGGTERLVNIKVKDNAARCVNSSDPGLKGLEGKFELIGNGVFRVVFQNQDYTASQWWVFRTDRSATVKEVPDRGEKERAIPVPDERIEQPKESGRFTRPQDDDAAQRR